MNTMNTQSDFDDFDILKSKPFNAAERAELYVQNSFTCPVCLLPGGPTFEGGNACQNYVMAYGLSIPSDHAAKCLPIAQRAFHFFVSGERRPQETHSIHSSGLPCMHPACVADRLWREPI